MLVLIPIYPSSPPSIKALHLQMLEFTHRPICWLAGGSRGRPGLQCTHTHTHTLSHVTFGCVCLGVNISAIVHVGLLSVDQPELISDDRRGGRQSRSVFWGNFMLMLFCATCFITKRLRFVSLCFPDVFYCAWQLFFPLFSLTELNLQVESR